MGTGVYRFREFALDLAAYELRRNGRAVRMERRPMDLLILLVERRGQLVSRTEIVERLWGHDVFVDVETGVHTAIRKVRQALRDSADAPSFIETVPGRGYRFIAPVDLGPGAPSSPPAAGDLDPAAPATPGGRPAPAAAPGATRGERRVEVAPASRTRTYGIFGAVVALCLLGAVAALSWVRIGAPAKPVTLAVLPFANLSPEPERAYLADGLVEDTIASLGLIDPERVTVIGRTSVLSYKDTTKPLAQIGQELGVDYLVEGSLRAEGGQVRVTAKLIRAGDQAQVWSDSYDRDLTSMLAVQRDLSTSIARQIGQRLSPERVAAIARRHTGDAEAYDLYLRGRALWHQLTPATNLRAIEYFRRATLRDPRYGLAWAGMADAHAASPINADAPALAAGARAREAAERALEADPQLPEAQFSRGFVSYYADWDWAAAERYFRRAIALDPGSSVAHRMLGHLMSQTHRQREAEAAMRRAVALDPYHPINHALSSQVAFQGRQYRQAVEHARRALAIDPESWIGYVQLAQSYEQLGRGDEALEALIQAARFSAGNTKTHALRGYILAKTGRMTEAREILQLLETTARERYVPPYALALVHAGLDERDAAFTRLNEAYDARDVHLVFLGVDPKWDPYREDPRFNDLLARCGFPPAPGR